MGYRNQRYSAESAILFLLFPFLGFIRACGRLGNPVCGIIFILFYGLFGYCHTFIDTRMDAHRLANEFIYNNITSWDSAYHQFTSGWQPDLFKVALFWLVGTVTKNPHVYFGIVGLFGAIFAYLAIRRTIKELHISNSLIYISLILLLILVFKPVMIGGIRFWSSIGLLSYAAIRIVIDRKYLWFIAVCIAPLIHFSAAVWIPIILIATFIRIPKKILFWSAIICCIMGSSISGTHYQSIVSDIVSSVGIENDSITGKTSFYSSDDATKEFSGSLTTKIMKVVSYFEAAWLIIALFTLKNSLKQPNAIRRNSNYIERIWKSYLLFAAFGYLMTGLSVVGSRYQFLSNIFIVLLFSLLLSNGNNQMINTVKKLIYLKVIISSIVLAQLIYNCYFVTSLELYWAPLPFVLTSV